MLSRLARWKAWQIEKVKYHILQFFSPVLLPDAEKVAQHRGWDHFATAAATFRLAGERNTDDLARVGVENRPTAVSRVNGGVDLPADHNQYTLETELRRYPQAERSPGW